MAALFVHKDNNDSCIIIETAVIGLQQDGDVAIVRMIDGGNYRVIGRIEDVAVLVSLTAWSSPPIYERPRKPPPPRAPPPSKTW
jgi:hypothetical protein